MSETINENITEKVEIPVPVPKPKEKNGEKDIDFNNINEDMIINMITSEDENGYSPSTIVASIVKLTNVTDITSIEDVPEENQEIIDTLEIEFCRVNLFTMNGDFVSLVLNFDNPRDSYLLELNELLNKCHHMQEHYHVSEKPEDENTEIMFTISILPNELEARGIANFMFPSWFAMTNDALGDTTNMQLVFPAENVEFSELTISDDDRTNMEANILRELESNDSGYGNLFVEE